MIKCIFVDFDGTILPKTSNSIPESCIKALNEAHEKGIYVFLCTGRSNTQLDEYKIDQIHFDGRITANGQLVYDDNANLIYDVPFNKSIENKLITIFNKKEIPICLLTKDDFYINFLNEFVVEKQNECKQSIPKIKEYNGEDIYLASCFIENDKQRNELLNLGDDVHISLWQNNGLDILNKGASKKNGVEHIIMKYNISLDECLAIGDGYNDLPVFDICKYSMAVGNANEEVKKHATYVSDKVENNGILKGLKYFNII